MKKQILKYFGEYNHNEFWRRFKCDNDNFQWISEDENILTVENGTIKPRRPGNTKVKAIAPNGDVIMTDDNQKSSDMTIEDIFISKVKNMSELSQDEVNSLEVLNKNYLQQAASQLNLTV